MEPHFVLSMRSARVSIGFQERNRLCAMGLAATAFFT